MKTYVSNPVDPTDVYPEWEPDIQQERTRWGFCPDCGENMNNPDVAYRHSKGKCRWQNETSEKVLD